MDKVIINTARTAYSADDAAVGAAKASELIEFLTWVLDTEGDVPVVLAFDNGYTYGGVHCDEIFTAEEWEEEIG